MFKTKQTRGRQAGEPAETTALLSELDDAKCPYP